MRRVLAIIRRISVGLAFLLLILIIGVAAITHTDRFREFVREQMVVAINDSIAGSISLGRLEGSIWGNAILHDVVVRHEGAEILQLPRLTISYSLLPLIWGRLHIFQLTGSRPSLHLRRGEDNELNIVQAFSPRQPQSEGDSGLVVLLNSIILREGHIDLSLAGPKPQNYSLDDLSLEGRIHVRPKNVTIDLSRVASRLTTPGFPELSVNGAMVYHETADTDTFEVANLLVSTGESHARVSGKLTDLQAVNVDAKIAVEKLAPSDVKGIFADWPLRRDVAGAITINGPLNALVVDVNLAAAGAKLAASLQIETAQETPRYRGTINLTGFDVRTLLGRNDVAGVLNASIEGQASGLELSGVDAKGVIKMQSTVVGGWTLGDISIDGRLRENVATVAGRLKSKIGGASWNGEISFKDKPAYDLALSVDNLDIQKTVSGADGLEGNLNFKGTLKGAGLTQHDVIVRTELKILPSTIGPVKVQQGSLVASLAQQRLQIILATARTEDSILTVKGEVGLEPKQSGRLDYVVRSANLTPWLALANQQGSGSLELSGRASGHIADLQSQGTIKLAGLRLQDTAVKSGSIDFDLRLAATQTLPQGTVKFRLAGAQVGVPLQRLEGTLALSSKKHYEIGFDMQALDQSQRRHTLAGEIDYQPQMIIARLDKGELNLDDGLWQLSWPATITQRGDSFDIGNLVLRNRAQQLAINGRFAIRGKQDLTVDVEGFPISGISAFLAKPLPMTGTLTLRAQITGTAAAPEITASLNLTDSSIGGQTVGGIIGAASYRARSADIKLTVRQDKNHELTANGTIPLVLKWDPQWQAEATGDMNVRVHSAGLSIAFLNAFSGEAAQNIAGIFALDVLARGPLTQPTLSGSFQLRDGALAVKHLGVQLANVTADGGLDGQTISIRQISARSKEGRLSGSGRLALRDYSPEDFKLSLSLYRWPLIETQQYRAMVAGNLEAQGPLAKPLLSGQLEVLNAELRPDLAFLGSGKRPLTRDETIVIIGSRNQSQTAETRQLRAEKQSPDNELLKNARLDLTVVMPNQVWIRHPDANVELSGKLRAVKQTGKDIALTGQIAAVRGWIGFQGRRFNLTRGTIEFTGGETINPGLDILAQYRLQQYQIDVTINGTLAKPALIMRSEPPLEQADILALLIFGKPLNALSRTEQNTLQQSAMEMAGGLAAAKVASAVSDALGLDRLGLDLGEIDITGGQIGFGRYIGNRTYVSISQELAGEAGREVSIEYQIGPGWKITSSTSTTGTSGVGILWHKRY